MTGAFAGGPMEAGVEVEDPAEVDEAEEDEQ